MTGKDSQMDWSDLDNRQLLLAYSSLMATLRERGVVRSSNNPVADYTESLVCRALKLSIERQSRAGYDAQDGVGTRYQIKGRRLTAQSVSTQLSALRNLHHRPFDVLAAVAYSEDFSVLYGALIPIEGVIELARFSPHSNSHVFMFRRSVLEYPGVRDITRELTSS